ncbi:SH3 domain-containing protein [Flammeovirga sp. MY04]|uniref:SH3 domain-containing protein n=1 Tax=Flammeovirga sp. MY04 TaxID=1191459 RepID=UPI000826D1D6|nr:SH3 domain-containing protein [Flammeovirga sp. MY04]ANQ50111.2 SH3 domain-containing protein [Flammeovirga sp. MY04]
MRFILSLISLYLLTFSQLGFGFSALETKISKADSLFESQQYIDAYTIYEDILTNDQAYSSRMLLRMAFIQEGQDNYSTALYYLNLQYRLTADRQTLNKMTKIAEENNLLGYQYSDKEFFVSLFNNMQTLFAAVLITLITVCLVLMFIRRKQSLSITTLTFFVAVFSIIGLWAFNGGIEREQAIVRNHGALLMNEPSAGGKKLAEIVQGERLKIESENDIWYKVILPNDAEGYIRKRRVFEVK